MGTLVPVDVRILRNYTAEPILPWLKREFAGRGMEPHCTFGEFSGAMSDIWALPATRVADAKAGLVVLTLSLELYSRDFGHADWECTAACEHVLSLVRTAVDRSDELLVVNTLLPPLYPVYGFAMEPGKVSHVQQVEELNLELRRIAAQNPGRVVLLDWTAYARELGSRETYDHRFWHSSGLPFSRCFLRRFASDLAAVAEVLVGAARKCLVLDCDNTLWGGVVGEDGPTGIRLSTDSLPGAYFQQFQRSVLDLHRQGVLLALCSKNNAADVFEVLDLHPDCLLKREHLAAWRVNWNDKAASLAEIAQELNIGIDALVFVDDSPQECERVRQALPAVRVLPVPGKPELLPDFLGELRPFPALVMTEVDSLRAASYQDNQHRSELAELANDASDYRKMLGTRMAVRPVREIDLDRVTQLFQKTNQFNLTTKRYDRGAVARLAADEDILVYCADVSDQFGDLGLVAVAVAKREGSICVIDSLMMSCRALGRDAEFAFIASVLDGAREKWGVQSVRAHYAPTPKNSQVSDFWLRVGLEPGLGPEVHETGNDRIFVSGDLGDLIERNRRPYVQEGS